MLFENSRATIEALVIKRGLYEQLYDILSTVCKDLQTKYTYEYNSFIIMRKCDNSAHMYVFAFCRVLIDKVMAENVSYNGFKNIGFVEIDTNKMCTSFRN